ncbi:probable DNA polymerase [Stegodyphus dumicola]|uniref:probable DNA polymerase n=1 Tax=Stegodyphus dumicola TaxID=202533 RepID=UPI0015AA3530|nr:probable DNA polymerase [Stegodyphus dumicola]
MLSFFGGRTNAIQLYYEGDAKYVDFTSLYPWVNKYCLYPVGHPNIITENFDALENYFGIIKCRILPPRGLYLPVLPYRAQNKLMFPLCKTCAELMYQGICQHSDDERAIIGTWVTEEVKLAVKKGYCITKVSILGNY